MPDREYTYSAFISYKHNPDGDFAATIQNQIERYVVPKEYRNSPLVEGNRMKKVFRDSTEFSGSHNLAEAIQTALSKAAFLIVIVSEETKNSPWVAQEIEFFLKDHERDHILTVISSGSTPSKNYPEALINVEMPDGRIEKVDPLAVDYRKYNPKRGHRAHGNRSVYTSEFPRIIAPLLGISYDDLYRRRERYKRRRILTIGGIAFAAMSIVLAYVIWSRIQIKKNYQETLEKQRDILIADAKEALNENDRLYAIECAMKALPTKYGNPDMPVTNEARFALSRAVGAYMVPDDIENEIPIRKIVMTNGIHEYAVDSVGRYVLCADDDEHIKLFDVKENKTIFEDSVLEYGEYKKIAVCNDEFFILVNNNGNVLLRLRNDGTIKEIADFNDSIYEMIPAGEKLYLTKRVDDDTPKLELITYEPKTEEMHSETIALKDSSVTDMKIDPEIGIVSFVIRGETDEQSEIGIIHLDTLKVDYQTINEDHYSFEYLVDRDRIYYTVCPTKAVVLTNKTTAYDQITITNVCLDQKSGKELWRVEEKGGQGHPNSQLLKYREDNSEYLVYRGGNKVRIYEPASGKVIFSCDYEQKTVDAWVGVHLNIQLQNGNFSVISTEGDYYYVYGGYDMNVASGKVILESYTGGKLSLMQNTEGEIVVFQRGWGDSSFVEFGLGEDSVGVSGGVWKHLSAIYLIDSTEDFHQLVLIDTRENKVLWKKDTKENLLFPTVRFSEDGSQIFLFREGDLFEDIAFGVYSVETGDEEWIKYECEKYDHSDENQQIKRTTQFKEVFAFGDSVGFLKKTKEDINYTDADGSHYDSKSIMEIYVMKGGKPEKLSLELGNYVGIEKVSVNESATYMSFFMRDIEANQESFAIYDIKNNRLMKVDGTETIAEDHIGVKVSMTDDRLVLFSPNENVAYIINNETGEILHKLEGGGSMIRTLDAHGDFLYVAWSDGNWKKYELATGNELAGSKITDYTDTYAQEQWQYDDGLVVLAFRDIEGNEQAYFVDDATMERQERIDERIFLYIPETDSIFVGASANGPGIFKRHTLDELIEMGYEQLGE